MTMLRLGGLFLLFSAFLAGRPAAGWECPITLPPAGDFTGELGSVPGYAWVGNNDLAARVPENGHWLGMGADGRYRDKFWWWREGYRARTENRPDLVIAAVRLDDSNTPPILMLNGATNAFGKNWDLMLTGMEFPSSGCWEMIGLYHGHQLTFILQVGDPLDDPVEEKAGAKREVTARAAQVPGAGHTQLAPDAPFSPWLRTRRDWIFDGLGPDIAALQTAAEVGNTDAAMDLHFLALRCPFVLDTQPPLAAWFEHLEQDYLVQVRAIGDGRSHRVLARLRQAHEYCSALGSELDHALEALHWITTAADLGHAGAQRLYHFRAKQLIDTLPGDQRADPIEAFKQRADRYVWRLIDAGHPQGYALMSRMLMVGDVYAQDYVAAHAYQYAVVLIAQGKVEREAQRRIESVKLRLRPEQIQGAEILARQIVGR